MIKVAPILANRFISMKRRIKCRLETIYWISASNKQLVFWAKMHDFWFMVPTKEIEVFAQNSFKERAPTFHRMDEAKFIASHSEFKSIGVSLVFKPFFNIKSQGRGGMRSNRHRESIGHFFWNANIS
ncbi:MAG: hypothetical protein RLZZ609_1421 [Cyanobacteriota bacterium]|jgi:hypothetical protein